MAQEKPEITPALTVHKLLNAYPELEDVLIDMAPPFEKLRNPFLRKSVAKVATIRHIASVGSLTLDELIKQLRVAVGQAVAGAHYDADSYYTEQPGWFDADKIALSIVEDELENKDEMPLLAIMREAKQINVGEIIELITIYLPAPGIDILKARGYWVWVQQDGEAGTIKSYFLKNA